MGAGRGRENEQTQKVQQPVVGQVYLSCVSKQKHVNPHPAFPPKLIYILHFFPKNGLKSQIQLASSMEKEQTWRVHTTTT